MKGRDEKRPKIKVRAVRRDDLPALVRLSRQLARYHGEELIGTRASMAEALFGRPAYILGKVAVIEGRVVGYVTFYRTAGLVHRNRKIFVDLLVTDAAARGLGVGTALLQALADLGCREQVDEIRLEVRKYNKDAQAFYRTVGFDLGVPRKDNLRAKLTKKAIHQLREKG